MTRRPRPALRAPAALAWALLVACGGGSRDVVTPSTDVVSDAKADPQGGGYEYVSRRPFAVVALAEARGVDPAIAHAAVDHLADAVERCVTDAQHRGATIDGAARIVGQIDASGAVSGATIRVDPKAGDAATGVVCFLAPARLLVFPAADRTDRGFAIEAIWGAGVPR